MRTDWSGQAFEAIVDAVVVSDLQGQIQALNPGAERLFGYSADEAEGQHIELLAVDGREWEPRDIIARVSSGEVYHSPEATRRHKDGRLLQVAITWAPIRGAGGNIDGIVGVFRDTGNAAGVSLALEDRRASDILASFISSLFALALDLEQAVATQSFELVNAARDRIGGLVEGLRADAEQLARLDSLEEGMTTVLTQLVQRLVPRTTTVTLNLHEVNPSVETAQALVYVATEALINAVRHSAATRIAVELRESADMLVLVVQDDGGGFDIDRVSHGLGLGRMKLWASRMNGEVAVFSVPGMGTTVRTALPVSA